MNETKEAAAQHLVELVGQYAALDDRESEPAKNLVGKIRAMGYAASFFNGYDGMSALCKAAESIDRTTGYWINYIWAEIAGWMP